MTHPYLIKVSVIDTPNQSVNGHGDEQHMDAVKSKISILIVCGFSDFYCFGFFYSTLSWVGFLFCSVFLWFCYCLFFGDKVSLSSFV